jgi:A118 family predicted phage portal protein
MPEANTVWPPEHLAPVFQTIATNKTLYRGPEAPDLTTGTGWVATAQAYGGIVGAIARVLWGNPVSAQVKRPERHHVPVPADIATLSADLLFSEAPRILPPDDTSDEVKARIDTVVNNATNHSKFLEAAELAAALCGVYLRIVWDSEVADHPMLDVVYPDQAVPTFRWGKLVEVTFWDVVETDKGGRVWRHLEHHAPGRIEHALYKGEKNNLGQLVPLTDHTATEWLAEYVDADAGMPTGTENLTAAYIPNALPSRQHGDNPDTAPYGRSDYEGVEQLFLDLDDAYTSWMRDIRLAKSRIFVDEHALQDNGPGKGMSFDPDHEVYTQLRGYGAISEDNRNMVQAQQFAIRDKEHRESIKHILANILRATGYSPSTFGEEAPSSQTTAKEIRSREQASKRTWTKKQRHWEAQLKPLLETLLEVDAFLFESSPIPQGQEIDLEFKISNSLEGDVVDLAETIRILHSADAISLDQTLRMLYPNWSRTQLNEEADKIRAERPHLLAVPDPETEGRAGESFNDLVQAALETRNGAQD